MSVFFSKITTSPKQYRGGVENVEIICDLSQSKTNLVNASSKLVGELSLVCDRCLEVFTINVDENIEFILSDGEYKGNDSLDVIEFYDGKIDLESLLDSEIQSLKNDYHLCKSCQDLDEYEVEY
jgi:uncharacterized metal-binding protein YceD (DUF177 family)